MTKQEKREYYRAYRERNREKILEYQREWYSQNREAVCLMRKAKYILKRKKEREIKKPIMPRKYYNKIIVYAIKSTKGYIANLQNKTFTHNVWDSHFFKERKIAELNAEQFENAQVVRIDLREQIGTQEIFW